MSDTIDILDHLVARARAAGADAADGFGYDSRSLAIRRRMGKPEQIERAEDQDVGLRVFFGRRMASASSSDRTKAALDRLVDQVVTMARAVPEDPCCGLAAAAELAERWPDLDLADPAEATEEDLIDWSSRAEDVALDRSGITNSEGAEASWSQGNLALVGSNGFSGSYRRSGFSIGLSVVAADASGMETDHAYSSTVFRSDLDTPEEIGRLAAERALRRLGARKVATAQVPVVFDPRVSASLIGHLAGAVNGGAIARGTSFLKDEMGAAIFDPSVTIIDDAHRRRGLRSHPFDGEGLPGGRRAIIEDGVLKTWILDLRSARQLGLRSTGHARRGTSRPPSAGPSNLYLTPGPDSPAELMADIAAGFYVTAMMGSSVNLVTGDYSRGASGFWIEKGTLTYPVNEVTVAGHLRDMFGRLRRADDLEFRFGTNAPTLRIDGMTVAGR